MVMITLYAKQKKETQMYTTDLLSYVKVMKILIVKGKQFQAIVFKCLLH